MNSLPQLHSVRINITPCGVMTFLTGRRLGKNSLFVSIKSQTNPAAKSLQGISAQTLGETNVPALDVRATWSTMKCALADIRNRYTKLTAATAHIPTQTPKKPTVSAVVQSISSAKSCSRSPADELGQRTDFSLCVSGGPGTIAEATQNSPGAC